MDTDGMVGSRDVLVVQCWLPGRSPVVATVPQSLSVPAVRPKGQQVLGLVAWPRSGTESLCDGRLCAGGMGHTVSAPGLGAGAGDGCGIR